MVNIADCLSVARSSILRWVANLFNIMNIFFISDTHWAHEGPYSKFLREDGCTMLRPHGSAAEGDEAMVKNWNSVVSKSSKVYHLGDVTMSVKSDALNIMYRLNGEKILIKGNHDKGKLSHYQTHFKDVRGSHQFDGMILTHIPIHLDSLACWGFNVHGHTHANSVQRINKYGVKELDPNYFCVSVEQINYTPISLEEVKKQAQERKDSFS